MEKVKSLTLAPVPTAPAKADENGGDTTQTFTTIGFCFLERRVSCSNLLMARWLKIIEFSYNRPRVKAGEALDEHVMRQIEYPFECLPDW